MNKYLFVRKGLAVGIILLFVGTGIVPTIAQDTQNTILPTSRGQWLYVGGSGPGNYTKIQDAIDDASDGDTVFVYSGLYYERISIPKALRLLGESKNNTTIDAKTSDGGDLIAIHSSGITISGFTLRFNGSVGYPRCRIIAHAYYYEDLRDISISNNILQGNYSDDIYLSSCDYCVITENSISLHDINGECIHLSNSKNSVITNNLITNNTEFYGIGIRLNQASSCTISNNSFTSGSTGIEITDSAMNVVSNNSFFNNLYAAIFLSLGSHNNSIISNHIDNSLHTILQFTDLLTGIYVYGYGFGNIIEKNFISHCMFGILLEHSHNTIISMNTFMKNIVHARFLNTEFRSYNIWNQNYWGRPRILPKPIFGIKDEYQIYPGFIEFDWHPAQKPYDIGG